MNKADLEMYKKLDNEFFLDCKRVRDILVTVKDKYSSWSEMSFAEAFYLHDDDVIWESETYYNYYCGIFPGEYLTMSDDELLKLVEEKNVEFQKKEEERKQKKEAAEKAYTDIEQSKKLADTMCSGENYND